MKTIIRNGVLAAALGLASLANAQQCPEDNHISCFTSIKPTAQTPKLIIAEDHNFQMIFKQGEAYTNPLGALTNVPGNHDFTAYIPMNGSSELGHLSVNHENNPGGVSILDLHFDHNSMLWSIDTTRPVDFYNNDLVTTYRNCSGGITPWGTVITSEEGMPSGDANNDGYQDAGWLVEIDPLTAKVVDYDNNGVQDKLWAHGRASRENAAIANDSVTVYSGEDGGSSAVFKFIADTPGDLSSGKLYALKLNTGLSGGEPTSANGQWVLLPNTTQADRNSARSSAQAVGATNFNGVEDCEIGTVDGMIYFTSKGNGRVYRFTDNGTSVSGFETYVGGTSYDIETAEGTFSEPWSYGNDNLCFDDKGNLWVLQDGDRDYVWVVGKNHTQANPDVRIWASFPNGSEPCGLTFSPDYRFGFISVQHPSGSNQPQLDATGNMVRFNASATVVFALDGVLGEDSVVVSNNDWRKSTVVTPTNFSGFWAGVDGMLPADSTFTDTAMEGQPYGYPSIYTIEGSEVLKAGNSISYYCKDFNVNSTDWNVRLRTTVDDQAEVYINGHRVAMIGSFGRPNYKAPAHDVVLFEDGSVDNGHNGGDQYTYVTSAMMDTILTDSTNKVVVVVRNLGKANDRGGFSFRMDLTKNAPIANAIAKSAVVDETTAFGIYPNPTSGELTINIPSKEFITDHEVSVMDINGRVLSRQTTSSDRVQMDLSGFSNGVYFIQVVSGEEVSVEKIVKH